MLITPIKKNLERISKAKTDIISAITAKGGTVASGAKIEDLPACIRAIPTSGSGGGSGGETVKFGVKSSINVTVTTKFGQWKVDGGGDEVAVSVTVGDILIVNTASNAMYFNNAEGSGYKELGAFRAMNRIYVYWVLIEEAGNLMLSV